MLSCLKYEDGVLSLLDQRLLPHQEVWLHHDDLEGCALSIETMVVRGAPAIGQTAAFALAVDARREAGRDKLDAYRQRFQANCKRLAATRPTAVNLFDALNRASRIIDGLPAGTPMTEVTSHLESFARKLHSDDLETCRAMGRHGADLADGRQVRVLTHCNAGSLATAGYGTALGVIRALHERGQIREVFVDETRPYLQGARLTAFEMAYEKIPYRLVVDSVAPWLMSQGLVDMVVTGADRIAANGDAANKIGTYGLAVAAAHHGVPFYIAAPATTFDPETDNGLGIPVEERHPDEVRAWGGNLMAPNEAPVFNPSFDVTPAALIRGIITEAGVLKPPYRPAIRRFLDGVS